MELIVPILDANEIVRTVYQLIHPKLINHFVWERDTKEQKINVAHRLRGLRA